MLSLITAAAAAAAAALGGGEPNPPVWPDTVRVFGPADADELNRTVQASSRLAAPPPRHATGQPRATGAQHRSVPSVGKYCRTLTDL